MGAAAFGNSKTNELEALFYFSNPKLKFIKSTETPYKVKPICWLNRLLWASKNPTLHAFYISNIFSEDGHLKQVNSINLLFFIFSQNFSIVVNLLIYLRIKT